jgi:hypothetical protein
MVKASFGRGHMSSNKRKDIIRDVDVLILHGMSKDIVDYLNRFFKSMNIRSSTVMELPARKLPQEKKVNYYIKNCKIALVLATHDEETGDKKRARPNVYDEIARCRKSKPRDTIVLQEKTVVLASNVLGAIPSVIPFDPEHLHLMIPNLLTELKEHNLIYTKNEGIARMEVGWNLNEFLDEMDNLWDNEFDQAWEKIHRLNYGSESNFALTLDKFFQKYQEVFSVLVRNKMSGYEMKETADKALIESRKYAAVAWEYVAEAKLRKIDDERKNKKTLHYQKLYEEASSELRHGKRKEDSFDKIKHFRKSIDLADKYINKIASKDG